MTHELHPLCTLFPQLGDAEFAALVADIQANGLCQPIVLHQDMILDGRNRYRACLAAGVAPTFVEFDGGNLVSFVLSSNLHRRHMTPGQQAAIVASAQDWAKAHEPHRQSGKGSSCHPSDTVATRAAKSGASRSTQQRADKVAREAPDLAKEVGLGNVSLPDAVEQVTGKRPGAKPKPPEPDHDDGDTLESLIDELQAENTRLVTPPKPSAG
jgi:hypothetical protein